MPLTATQYGIPQTHPSEGWQKSTMASGLKELWGNMTQAQIPPFLTTKLSAKPLGLLCGPSVHHAVSWGSRNTWRWRDSATLLDLWGLEELAAVLHLWGHQLLWNPASENVQKCIISWFYWWFWWWSPVSTLVSSFSDFFIKLRNSFWVVLNGCYVAGHCVIMLTIFPLHCRLSPHTLLVSLLWYSR